MWALSVTAVFLGGSPPNENRNYRRDCKHEQSHRSLILYGIACLADASPHVYERGDQPKRKKTLDRRGDHSRCCSPDPTAKEQAHSQKQKASDNYFQRMH